MQFYTKLRDNHPAFLGRAFALCCALSGAWMSIFMRLIRKDVHLFTILPIQNAFATFLCLSLYWTIGQGLYNEDPLITTLLFFRGLLGGFFYMGFNYGLRFIPPQKFIVLCNTLSIWVILLSPFILKEYPTARILGLLVMTMTGIIIMVEPSLILPNSWIYGSDIDNQTYQPNNWPAICMVMLGTFFGSLVSLCLKYFPGKITPCQNSGYFILFSSIYSGLFRTVIQIPSEEKNFGFSDFLCMVGVGMCQIGYQSFLVLASKYEPRASYISLLTNTQIAFTYLLDYFILGAKIEFLSIVGGILVFGSSTAIAFSKEDTQKSQVEDNIQKSEELK